jgi:hypothetical protein
MYLFAFVFVVEYGSLANLARPSLNTYILKGSKHVTKT